jgi:hypothetical protein
MSDEAKRTYVLIAALAMKNKIGIVKTVNYMRDNGYTTNEAIDIMAMFEDAEEQVAKGLLPERQ